MKHDIDIDARCIVVQINFFFLLGIVLFEIKCLMKNMSFLLGIPTKITW